MSIVKAKQAARNDAKRALAGVTPPEVAERSARACAWLIDRWPEPEAVMAYLAMPQEADPAGAIAFWRARGVTVCVPRTDWNARTMEPAVLGGRVVDGPKGIREAELTQPTLPLERLDLVIVPGLAYTCSGGRLGRGAGFYDRFLARLEPSTVRVGLALGVQMREELPTEPTDLPVDWVVTEDGAAPCRTGQHGLG
ncbi:MAG: 5-formyltetrahydrofolate cyclo-ligase [Planctomycetota bacterium]